MSEIIFEVTEAEEGGYNPRALGFDIFTQGADVEDLKNMVRDAVECHFADETIDKPRIVRLHFVRDEVLAL
ncbi:2-oxoisovalerate dehydrogenase [Oscillatoria amoena NRMC-F 0135]|nr:2-oxoisovalerate dehydrogenase [Oscillatoria laete-virens]MDL5046248.1 2-oxoisovalerate dehydrogenase [Oscillatoria amoena NRMC-F 0135]MDL5053927.1 2-oxoisovalerate dehydrogenase [Oscillatoria laete-virens NRMC-F 0139]